MWLSRSPENLATAATSKKESAEWAKKEIQAIIAQKNIDAEWFKNMPEEDLQDLANNMETLFDAWKLSIIGLTYWLHGQGSISANMKYGSNWKVMNTKTLETRDEPKQAPRFID